MFPPTLRAPHEAFQRRCEINSAYYGEPQQQQLRDARECSIAPRIGRILTSCSGSRASAEPLTVFHSKTLPQLSLFELGSALNRLLKCGETLLLVTLVLAERYCDATKTQPTALMMHRLYVACLQVATKAHSDVYLNNAGFARYAGISLAEINRLEREIVTALDWRLQVTKEELDAFLVNGTASPVYTGAASNPLKPPVADEAITLPIFGEDAADVSIAGSFGVSTPYVLASASGSISFGCAGADDLRRTTSPFSQSIDARSSSAVLFDDCEDPLACG